MTDGYLTDDHHDENDFYQDGISTPTIENVNAQPGDKQSGIVTADVILLGQPAAGNVDPNQSWIKDGSFMAFRELQQLVPEFQNFCDLSAKKAQNPNVSGDFIGARIVGRWKSGETKASQIHWSSNYLWEMTGLTSLTIPLFEIHVSFQVPHLPWPRFKTSPN